MRTYYNSDFAGAPTDGVYHLVNAESGKALAVVQGNDENASQLIQTSGRGRETSWLLKRNYDGTYSILSRQNGKSADLTADRNVTENGTAVTQYDYHGGINQKWYVMPTENGRFKLISALSGKAPVSYTHLASAGTPQRKRSWKPPRSVSASYPLSSSDCMRTA